MLTRLVIGVRWIRGSAAGKLVIGGACAVLAAGLAGAPVASAAGQPTVGQVQARVNQLNAQFDRAVQQYDQVASQLTAARAQLTQISTQVARDQRQFQTAHAAVAQIAAAAYEGSGSTSLAGMLTTSDPAKVLSQASMMLQIAGARNQQTLAYLDAARQLDAARRQQQRAEQGIAALLDQKARTKNHIGQLLKQQKATLNGLTAGQQQQVSVSGSGGTTNATYTGPTATQAQKAVAFAYSKLGCPYLYGGTGPCGTGYDCSGLIMQAWASAGVTIPRDTYSMWAALPHISASSLQPGDLLFYNGIGHVSIYVGNGYIIDSPHTGAVVQKIPMNESWYASNFDGAARA